MTQVKPEIDYTAALRYARTMRQHYASLIASLQTLGGHECGTSPGQCGDTEGKNLWHVALYLPEAKESDVLHEIQHDTGCPVYRAWPVDRETHSANVAVLEAEAANLARIAELEQLATQILDTYHQRDDGYRGRVGQVQIARWRTTLTGQP